MNSNKQRVLVFTVLVIAYTLFDYFFLRGPADETAPEAHPAQVETIPPSEKP